MAQFSIPNFPFDLFVRFFHSNLPFNIFIRFFHRISDPTHSAIATTVDSIADAVTHARFVGSDQASDGVVLMKVVQVLRTLILSPEGSALTDESVCEVMLSCIRICFEPRLNELLRRTAEQVLKDIVLLLFMRLPQFAEERHASGFIKKLKMMASGSSMDSSSGKRRRSTKSSSSVRSQPTKVEPRNVIAPPAIEVIDTPKSSTTAELKATPNQSLLGVQKSVLATTPSTPLVGNIVDMQGKFMQTPNPDSEENTISDGASNSNSADGNVEESAENDVDADNEDDANDDHAHRSQSVDSVESNNENASTSQDANPIVRGEDFVNSMGVRFTPQTENGAFYSKYTNFFLH